MLNFIRFCDEPIERCPLARQEHDLKKRMQRLAPGFDLMLINSNIGATNLRIVPGYMFSHIDPKEIPKEKNMKLAFYLAGEGRGLALLKQEDLLSPISVRLSGIMRKS